MELKATEFRKNLFQVLDSALHGETVEIIYKGSKLRLAPPQLQKQSRLSRMVKREGLLVDPESIVESDPELMAEFEAEWEAEWKELY